MHRPNLPNITKPEQKKMPPSFRSQHDIYMPPSSVRAYTTPAVGLNCFCRIYKAVAIYRKETSTHTHSYSQTNSHAYYHIRCSYSSENSCSVFLFSLVSFNMFHKFFSFFFISLSPKCSRTYLKLTYECAIYM